MIEALRELIRKRLADGLTVVVFPSQVAADAWAIEALRMGEGANRSRAPFADTLPRSSGRPSAPSMALDPDRMIGWDRFKESFLSRRREERPANRVTRTLWAALVVSRQTEEPFLRRILGTGNPSSSFVGFLAALPPSLAAIALAAATRKTADDPLIDDLLALHRNCKEFMASRGLFEPSWEKSIARPLDRPHLLLAPELVEDWEEWRELLRGVAGFETWALPDVESPPPLLSYPSAWEEYRDVFLRIGGLIDAGAAPDEIGVSVADLDTARPWIEEAAAKAGVPLAFRRGIPLASSPFGRLVSAMGAAARTGFGLPAMKSLLLDRFAKWKDADSAAALVRFGIDHHAFASWTREGRQVDVWEESFRVTGKTGLRSWYRRLKAAVFDVGSAADFMTLRAAVTSFRRQFLDEEEWSPEEARLVERCMEELEALARAEAEYARGVPLPSPFALWLATLKSESYVPQRRGSFVQVYPWRVSALLPFRFHFLLGCGFEEVAVRYGGESFLREDQKEALGRSGRDATDDFLRAYVLSGDQVFACHATEEVGGWSAPHPFFLPANSEDATRADAPAAPAAPDPLAIEAAAWRGAGRLPAKLLTIQKNAFANFAATTPADEADDPFDPLDEKTVTRLAPRFGRDGLVRLSHSLLAEYRACPFRWLVGSALRVEAEILDPGFFDARLAGEMAHKSIEWLLGSMRAFGPIDAAHLADYRKLAELAPAAILPVFSRDKGPFLEPMFEAWSPLLADRLLRLVAALVEDPGWDVGELETKMELAFPEEGYYLEGRLDRLARRGEELAIVDYKKGRLPAKADLLLEVDGGAGEDGEGEVEVGTGADEGSRLAGQNGELGNTQIAAYITLLDTRAKNVTRASFWSVEQARALEVIGPEGLRPAGDYEAELASFRSLSADATRGILAGRFGWAPPSSLSCINCDFKTVCRSHYSAGR